MTDLFDPYEQWLGIAPHERPVDHYRLLGLPHFEEDQEVIHKAAEARMAMIRNHQVGKRGEFTQQILNELSAARLCLQNPSTKSTYDDMLRGRFAAVVPAETQLPPMAAYTPPPFTAPAMVPYQPTAPMMPPPPPPPTAPPPAALRVGVSTTSGQRPASDGTVRKKKKKRADRKPLHRRPWFWPVAIGACFVFAALGWLGYSALTSGTGSANRSRSSGDVDGEVKVVDASSLPPLAPLDPRVPVMQEGSGQINLSAQFAQIQGERLRLGLETGGKDQLIAQWTDAREYLSWKFKVIRPGLFKVHIVYYAEKPAKGSAAVLEIADQTHERDIQPTTSSERYTNDIFYLTLKDPGDYLAHFKVKRMAGDEFVIFKTITLTPAQSTEVTP